MPRIVARILVLLALPAIAAPASAQWSQIAPVPTADVFSVWAIGDTIVAGVDTATWVSTNAGQTWKSSVRLSPEVTSVQAVRIRNGRIYAGTYGQGVFVSDDLGDSWTTYNQGLVGGPFDAQLFVIDLLIFQDQLIAATSGAGAWIRNLNGVGGWSHYGNAFEPNQSSNMNAVAAGNGRLFACAGFNGNAFWRDPGAPDWTLTWLNNSGIAVGLAPLTAVWTGQHWVIGSNIGVFYGTEGHEPWSFSDVGLGTLFSVSFGLRGPDLFASFGTGVESQIAVSHDHGVTWDPLETLFPVFIYQMTVSGDDLYAARFDGLWKRSIATTSVPPSPASPLRFRVAGLPAGDRAVRFLLELPEAGSARIEVFDVSGRQVAAPIERTLPAGSSEIAWDAGGLRPGVYLARVRVGSSQAVARLIRTR